MEAINDNEAMTAYLSLLKSKGASSRDINLRKHFLRHLVSVLKDKPKNGDAYRYAVDKVLANFPDSADVNTLPLVARDFYYFWIGDIKQIALMNAKGGLAPNPVLVSINGTLTDMMAEMDAAGWEVTDIAPLTRYMETLENAGQPDSVRDIRERLLRLLLYVIRDHEPTSAVYRAGVDAMQTLFKKEDIRHAFIQVAREFFYYWIERTPEHTAQ